MSPDEKRLARFERRRALMLFYFQMVQRDALEDIEEALQAFRLSRTFMQRLARASYEDIMELAQLGANGTLPLGLEVQSGHQLLLGQIQAMEETGRIDITRQALAVRSYGLVPEE